MKPTRMIGLLGVISSVTFGAVAQAEHFPQSDANAAQCSRKGSALQACPSCDAWRAIRRRRFLHFSRLRAARSALTPL